MPPRIKYDREKILNAAIRIARRDGEDGITARALASEMGCSSKPIFRVYRDMSALHDDVLDRCKEIYLSYVKRIQDDPTYPKYKAYGMGYIMFAMEDTELFRILFLRNRFNTIIDDEEHLRPLINSIATATKLNYEHAYRLHLEMWLFVHGIATTIVTSYAKWNITVIDNMLTDQYLGVKKYLLEVQNAGNKD